MISTRFIKKLIVILIFDKYFFLVIYGCLKFYCARIPAPAFILKWKSHFEPEEQFKNILSCLRLEPKFHEFIDFIAH